MRKFILHFETSGIPSSFAIGEKNGQVWQWELPSESSNSSVLLPFLDAAFKQLEINRDYLLAISLSKGPGSYTGLRIGTSTAKALCYAWDIPLITIPTLFIMAKGMQQLACSEKDLLIPMIDFRRMEVVYAVFDKNLNLIKPQTNIILDEHSFEEFKNYNLILGGSGSRKARLNFKHSQIQFADLIVPQAKDAISQAFILFEEKTFADVAYFEPDYGKEYLAKKSKVKGLF
ncbi:MAG: tRNA (adenosine(37)-N6)-threonylcarbamoyltransferase complex dimerization subunit type 1 TsaB [Bacteroidales bacterium]|nr:tRNA (adenosine(37)-N6)-threonylcarbamoyltransferase complex dimerization subunit type 1 TsaB [Bacteroidales bacterium]